MIKEKLLTAEHPDVAMTLNNLAVLCKAQGRYPEAEALYRRALAIFELSFGPESLKVITCRNNHATLMRMMERRTNEN